MRKGKNYQKNPLQTLFEAKQESMLTDFRAVRKGISHAPTMGNSSQERWRNFLRQHLPNRYCVDEAHIIDSLGAISEQIDLVIYDRQYANLVINQEGILYIPAESAFAVFEIKQNLNRSNLVYGGKKIASVRKLCRTSAPVMQMSGSTVRKKPQHIIGCLLAVESDFSPAYGATFLKHINALKNKNQVDLVFTLKDGLFKGKLKPSLGLVEFMYVLLDRLQGMGNAPAIDFNAYIQTLE